MASKAVMDAIGAYVAAGWDAAPIYGPNTQSKPPTGRTPFVMMQFPVSGAERVGLGRIFQEDGAVRFVVHVAVGSGVDQALIWADELAELLRERSFDGVQTWTPSPPTFDDRNEDGGWYRVSVAVPFTRTFEG